uniref:NADH dehydrogenase subunit 4L n=1 Tax=Cylindrus obtusus TaxID=649475 RepID=I1T1X1_9EUPU|nr:NADH dehydrogenase subunit 4L [Cylindrus obtusus]AEK48351.1 NADH dehydrogenase subunit 4L [Cylindrus obtusus]
MAYSLTVLLFFFIPMVFFAKNHLLSVLISLEIMMFFVLLLLFFPIFMCLTSLTYLMVFLCFAASGAAVGLTLLISMGRLSGND